MPELIAVTPLFPAHLSSSIDRTAHRQYAVDLRFGGMAVMFQRSLALKRDREALQHLLFVVAEQTLHVSPPPATSRLTFNFTLVLSATASDRLSTRLPLFSRIATVVALAQMAPTPWVPGERQVTPGVPRPLRTVGPALYLARAASSNAVHEAAVRSGLFSASRHPKNDPAERPAFCAAGAAPARPGTSHSAYLRPAKRFRTCR